jgi:hypothetical protein
MARALLEACSASVRDGACVLSTQETTEPRIAVATVRWGDPSQRDVLIEVHLTSDASVARTRTIVFKESDALVERWRSVGLTVATLVGDALAPKTADAGAQSTAPSGTAAFPLQQGAASGQQSSEPAAAAAAAVPPNGAAPPIVANPAPAQDTAEREGPRDGRRDEKLPRTFWAGLSGTLGPGLDQGAWRIGALVDAGYRPANLPIFARVSFEYATRGTDSEGLFVHWTTATIGGGGVLGTGALRAEPHLGLGVENVHAAASDGVTGKSDSGNQLGLTFHGGLDGVFQLSRLGIVAFLQGKQALAATRIVVKGQPVGTSPATGWGFGVGVRYFFE